LGIRGDLTLDFLGVLTVDGSFNFSSGTQTLILSDGSSLEVNAIELSAVGANGFLGFPGNDTLDRVGFFVEDLDLGLAIYTSAEDPAEEWTLLDVAVGTIGFTGLPGVELSASDLTLGYFKVAPSGLAINFDLSPINFGNPDFTINLSMSDIGLDLGLPDFSMSDLNVAFPEVDIDWSSLPLPDLLAELAALDLPGLSISLPDVDVDWPDLTLAELSVEFPDLGIDWANLSIYDFVINLPKLNLPGLEITMEFPDLPDFGSIFQFIGDFDINLFDLVQFEQSIDLQLEFETLILSDETSTEVVYASFAVTGLDIFAGFGTVGLQIDNLTIQTGATLNSIFLRHKLINKISIVVAPALIGGKETPSLIDGKSLSSVDELKDIKALKLVDVKKLNDSYLHLKYDMINDTIID